MRPPVWTRRIVGVTCFIGADAVFNHYASRPFANARPPNVSGLGIGHADTTRAMPAATTASAHGGVLP